MPPQLAPRECEAARLEGSAGWCEVRAEESADWPPNEWLWLSPGEAGGRGYEEVSGEEGGSLRARKESAGTLC